ncbi:hypothetical protein LIER_19335 [Lithospermum erythrorhizon]|uniref:Uncharacterized protein n=1 Tax=Lithospermum erythrorhizon TaxID=34254 RepID=A0AAV3QMZ3_LITER
MAGGGILRDTPSPLSIREPSTVRVIDATTLNQEVNDDVFRDIDECPANPIALVSMDVDQELPAGSSTRVVEPPSTEGIVSQSAGEQGEDSDDLPSYIANSLPVLFTNSQLWDIKEYFSIPDDVGVRVPVEGESIMAPIVNERDTKGAFCFGWTPLFLDAFSFGMQLPFSMFLNDLFEHINKVPGQVHPIGSVDKRTS